ncbi:MAG: hypothetical protein NTZ76_08865 [Actinobacteria bacterium]|nr:hypothetical protein [Actinomycetota bacterium]
MTITEAERFQMHEALSTAHGKEVAAIIMEHLPPTGWGDVARRSDVADLRVLTTKDLEMVRIALTSDMQALRIELTSDMQALRAELRGEMQELRAELRGEMQELRAELCGEMSVLRADMRSEMHMLFNKQLKWIVGVVISAQALGTGALLAGMKLL